MWEVLEAIENSGFATFVRETPSALGYSTVLAFHTFGMSFLVGLSGMIALRALGFGRTLPLAPMEKFFPLVIVGFWVNAASGIVLTMLAARALLRNPDFYVKLVAIAGALVTLRMLRAGLFGEGVDTAADPVPLKTRIVAVAMLIFWAVAVTAGRLTAYSPYVRSQSVVAIVIASFLMLLARHVGARVFRSATPQLAPMAPPASHHGRA
jgi:hypothetical protein